MQGYYESEMSPHFIKILKKKLINEFIKKSVETKFSKKKVWKLFENSINNNFI